VPHLYTTPDATSLSLPLLTALMGRASPLQTAHTHSPPPSLPSCRTDTRQVKRTHTQTHTLLRSLTVTRLPRHGSAIPTQSSLPSFSTARTCIYTVCTTPPCLQQTSPHPLGWAHSLLRLHENAAGGPSQTQLPNAFFAPTSAGRSFSSSFFSASPSPPPPPPKQRSPPTCRAPGTPSTPPTRLECVSG
jgi:hypothetical protein